MNETLATTTVRCLSPNVKPLERLLRDGVCSWCRRSSIAKETVDLVTSRILAKVAMETEGLASAESRHMNCIASAG